VTSYDWSTQGCPEIPMLRIGGKTTMTETPDTSTARTSPDILCSVQGVSKKFCKNLRRGMLYGLTDTARGLLDIRQPSDRLRPQEFWALRDVSLELRRGEVLGIVGRNGSGKTTLLRLLTGVFPPDTGTITINGRVAPLLLMGAGFHPHLSVTENIYLNGAILGISRAQLDERLQGIVEFSGLGEFAGSPVSSLSSGMLVRLGVSIALSCPPDILLIDEVLSAGDAEFRKKCLERIREVGQSSGVIFVSHNPEMVKQVCSRVVVLERGREKCGMRSGECGVSEEVP